MATRYELSDAQWERLKDTLPGRVEHVGRTAADNRLFVNGVLWILRSGARWHDLPERYGKYKSVHKRFTRWAERGVWDRIFADLVKDKKNLPDARPDHSSSTPASGHGPQKGGSGDKALGRSRGGLTMKVHLLTDENGLPVDLRMTAGQASDYTAGVDLLGEHRAEAVIADKGYDSAAIVAHIQSLGAEAVIASRSCWKQPRSFNRELYKQRNRIERCFNRLKQFRRFSTRYCKSPNAFRAFAKLACSWLRLELYVDRA